MKRRSFVILTLLLCGLTAALAQQGDPVVTLSAWDGGTWEIRGDAGGTAFSARVTMGTQTKKAQVNKFAAGEPMAQYAEQWNVFVGEPGPNQFGRASSGYASVLESIANAGGRLSVSLNKDGTVKSMVPIP